jgi:hypothetical protein
LEFKNSLYPKLFVGEETSMTLLLLAGTLFAVLTLGLLVAYFVTGAKNNKLRYLAGASAIVMALIWMIKSFMR